MYIPSMHEKLVLTFSYIARQPILDVNRNTFGYELLFRDGEKNAFPDISGEEATSRLIVEQQFVHDIQDLVGNHRAFINFSRFSLLDEQPNFLPPREVVIEILESVVPDSEVIGACRNLKKYGYSLALDDHDFNKAWHQWLHLFDIVKIDIGQFSRQELCCHLSECDFGSVRLLAERVETEEDFAYCREQGFSLFQGYFFARPQMIRKTTLPAGKLSTLQLLSVMSKEDFEFGELENLISSDVGLTYKLLRFSNSAYFGVGSRISSLKQALVYLGQKEIKKFVAIIAIVSIAERDQNAVLTLSVVRANFCGRLAEKIENTEIPKTAFLIGLLSMIDTLLEDNMSNLLGRLPLEKSIGEALVEETGSGAELLQMIKYIELADWPNVANYSERYGLSEIQIQDLYKEAVSEASKLMSTLRD